MSYDQDDDATEGEFVMTREQLLWARKLQKHLDAMPAGIELLVGSGRAHIHEAGWYDKNILDASADMMTAGSAINEAAAYMVTFSESRIRPNSESI